MLIFIAYIPVLHNSDIIKSVIKTITLDIQYIIIIDNKLTYNFHKMSYNYTQWLVGWTEHNVFFCCEDHICVDTSTVEIFFCSEDHICVDTSTVEIFFCCEDHICVDTCKYSGNILLL